ncbi:cytochrome c oxidase assembly protein [Thermaurantiacus sp.]
MILAANTRTALVAGGIAIAMVGLSYASVPLYRLFCQVTGFGGTPMVAAEGEAGSVLAVPGTSIRVRFDGNVRRGLPWTFAPSEPFVDLPVGERRMAFYRVTNHGDAPITGVATFNVAPEGAGPYFVKVQCFCFEEQTLEPGETVDMPVVYYVDPAILDDPESSRIEEITLSYSFFPVARKDQAAQEGGMAAIRARQP